MWPSRPVQPTEAAGRARGWWPVEWPLPSALRLGKPLPDPGPVSSSGKRQFTETTHGRAQPGAWACERLGKGGCHASCPSGLWRVDGRNGDERVPVAFLRPPPPPGTRAVRPWILEGRELSGLLDRRREGSCLVPQQGWRCLRPQAWLQLPRHPQGEPASGSLGPGHSALSPRGLLELVSSGQEVASPVSSGLWKTGGPALAVGENLGRGAVSPVSP